MPRTRVRDTNSQTKTLGYRLRVIKESRRSGPVLLVPRRGCCKRKRGAPSQWVKRRHYIVNSEGIHFTASRYIVGRTNAKRCTPNRRGNGRNHFGDFRDASSSAIAVD